MWARIPSRYIVDIAHRYVLKVWVDKESKAQPAHCEWVCATRHHISCDTDLFPRAAETKYQELGGLKQQNSVLSQV